MKCQEFFNDYDNDLVDKKKSMNYEERDLTVRPF